MIQDITSLLNQIKLDKDIFQKSRLIEYVIKEKIGFIKGVRITQNSAFWQGFEKSKVLDLALDSYNNPRKIINLPGFEG